MRRALVVIALCAFAGCRRERPADAPLRLGYFANITHAQALAGVTDGTFARALGDHKLELKQFNAGPPAMEALLAGDVDVSYVGAAPAILAYVRSSGRIRVVATAAVGGAGLVVRDPAITTPQQLQGKRVSSPQVGNTQDVSLRHWLKANGLSDVHVFAVANAESFGLFKEGKIDAAWVPEPWLSKLLHEANGHLLVSEEDTPTTVLVASADALEHRRDQVMAIVRANAELTARAHADPKAFAALANQGFEQLTGKKLKPDVLAEAFTRLHFTNDEIGDALAEQARRLNEVGYLAKVDVSGIVDPGFSHFSEVKARRLTR